MMIEAILNLFIPPRCMRCHIHVPKNGSLCADCWSDLAWIGPPYCASCGRPFHSDEGIIPDNLICLDCAQSKPPFEKARSVFLYNDQSKQLILSFKHGDCTDYSKAFAQWMQRAGADVLETADVLVPVPLHRWRLIGRRYNQAGLLVQELSKRTGVPVDLLSLTRTRATAPQGKQGRTARYENLRNAFAVKGRVDFLNKRVVLVDDVMTTGATIVHCSDALLKAGARSVSVLTLARVERVVTPS